MFQAPPRTTTYVAPEDPIDVNQRYLVKVVELVDLGPTKYPQPTDDPNNPTHRIQWKFRMAAPDGNNGWLPVLDTDGNAYEHYDYTSSKTGKSTKASGKTSTARMWIEALYGHPLEEDEVIAKRSEFHLLLREKVAVALFEEKESGGEDGQESYMRLRILRLSPYKQRTKAEVAQAEQTAAADKAVAAVKKARATVDVGSSAGDEVPF